MYLSKIRVENMLRAVIHIYFQNHRKDMFIKCCTVINYNDTIPVRYTPKCKGIYGHECSQEEEETLQIPIMQNARIEVTCKEI